MKTDFDKEIDSLLRQQARRVRAPSGEQSAPSLAHGDASATPGGAHLDADELNAYAENALPTSARTRYAAHLADCDHCRRSVTSLALAAGIPVQLEKREGATGRVQKNIGWRERYGALFAPRAWRYAVPVFALLLVSAVVLTVLMQRQQENRSIASLSPAAQQKSQPAETEMHHPPQTDAAANAANAEAATTTVGGGVLAQNSNAPVAKEEIAGNARPPQEEQKVGAILKDSAPPPASAVGSVVAPATTSNFPTPEGTPAPVSVADEVRVESEARPKVAQPVEEAARDAEKSAGNNDRSSRDDAYNERRSGPSRSARSMRGEGGNNSASIAGNNDAKAESPALPPAPKPARARAANDEDKELARRENVKKQDGARAQSVAAPATRTVAGRKFRRDGDAWVDTAYNSSQSATVVRRNSEQFRALVADEPELRRIADALGGEVTVVWKGRAYRIR